MKLILVRHATRDLGPSADCSLNLAGQLMAQSLAQNLGPTLPKPDALFTSPKKRAQETLGPAAQLLGLPLNIETQLDERHLHEDGRVFQKRVENYLKSLMTPYQNGAVVLLCTHSDWLEEAVSFLKGSQGHFACAESRVYNFDGHKWSEHND
jgi:broad specificity phosphatase PhoE